MYFCHTKSKRFRIIHGEIIAQMINYQQYNSQSYYNGGYRHFFNGQEADNEVLGEGDEFERGILAVRQQVGKEVERGSRVQGVRKPLCMFRGEPGMVKRSVR